MNIPDSLKSPLVELLFSIADDKFILGHRNADWTGLAPMLEEDIAFSALAQDDLAHAATLYGLIAELRGGDPDQIAYGRTLDEYRSAQLVELDDEFDWATALVRMLYFSHFDVMRLSRLATSVEPKLAALSQRLLAESRIHTEHSGAWVARLGHARGESHERIQAALTALAPEAAMLFEPTAGIEFVEAAGVLPRDERDDFERWRTAIEDVVARGGLTLKLDRPPAGARGGRSGRHTAEFAELLDELTEVYRVEPQAAW